MENGKWSKSMIGYGDEDDHFVSELTYNYTVRNYEAGNSHIATLIHSPEIFKKHAKSTNENLVDIKSPSGYTFRVMNRCGNMTVEI